MPETHFDPYFDDESLDYDSKTPCGVVYAEHDAYGTSAWSEVSCKRCLKTKSKLQLIHDTIEKQIVDQMGDMANFIKSQNDSATPKEK